MRVRYDRASLIRLGSGLLVCAIAQWSGRAIAGAQLPIPCVATSCGTGVKGFVTSGSASAVQSGNTLSVAQTSNTATLNWSSFNIGAGGKVVFVQPASTSIALNRIFDTNPSSIFGALSANGQIYLINANGFLFGSGATVNVGGLLASSLNLSDATFASGLLVPGQTGLPALQPFVDASGNVLSQAITVQAGAQLTAADQGRLLLAAPNVTNGGNLTAPDGQVILAAGQSLYLQASSDPSLRGLIVEVDGGGTAANQLTGNVSTPRGNVTLTGLMVNQDGRVSATTSVNANGSIVLQAADTFSTSYSEGQAFAATRGGTVELGPGSATEVLPEYSDATTAVAAQVQLPSQITITGQAVLMHAAVIEAPAGNLDVTAEANPYLGVQSTGNPDAKIRIEPGTIIDLAGSQAELPMAANLVNVQLRSNEFADDPTQRGGALQSTPTNTVTVTVDVRADDGKGTPIADVSSAIAAVGQNIAQRTQTGGTAQFQSEGDLIFSPGASINVSGGSTTYLGGSIQTTKLIGANGQIYDIGSANPLLTYTGVINPTFTQTYDKWGIQEVIPTTGLSEYESTYVQGAAAGGVLFAAPSLALGGTLQASAVSGPYQRSAPPAGGTLTIGESIATTTYNDYLTPNVSFVTTPTPFAVADAAALPAETLQLPTTYLTSSGITNTTIYSNTSIALPSGLPLSLPAGASLSLVAPRIDVDSSITAVGGTLAFENVPTFVVPVPTGVPSNSTQRLGIGIGSGVTLDVSGQWTNDSMQADGIGSTPTYQNAGSIELKLTTQQSELVLGDYVSLLANGGAWLQSGGALAYGTGGNITLDASPAQAALQFGQAVTVQGFGTGTASGGTFSLLVPRLEISQGSGNAWTEAQRVDDLTSTTGPVLDLYAPLFSDYGFSAVNLTATGPVESYATTDVLTVESGTTINAQTSTLQLTPNDLAAPSDTPLSSLSQVNLLPIYERPTTNVSLSVLRPADDTVLGSTHYGTLDIQSGASILAGPGATIALAGEGGVTVSGTLRAPGGNIQLSIPSPPEVDPSDASGLTDPGYQPMLGIDLKPTAILDVSGTVEMTPNAQGLLTGTLLPGGAVSLHADRGTVIAEAGSIIDIQGSSATLDIANSSILAGDTREVVAGAGGSLTASSPESISLLGTLEAQAGVGAGGSAAAGSLEVDLVRGSNNQILSGGPSFPQGTLEIQLVNSTAGDTPSASSSNVAVLGAAQLSASGIDSLTLRAGGSGTAPASGDIEIDVGEFSLARQLTLDAPSLTVQASASLSAPYVAIGNSVANVNGTTVVPTPTSGSGSLTISAQQMNLLGNFAVQGAATVTFASSGDVQLEGTTATNVPGPDTGSIVTAGSLAIDALRVYPDTYTNFTISSLKGSGGTVSIGSTGTSPGTPLSADGTVSISADNIAVSGTLLAPFGSINLTANNTLTLASGSLVSVSGAGVDIPFGETELNQGEWIYTTQSGYTNQITAVPTKQITLTAPNVAVQSGATANISGGGDLYAYEWVPGTGGTYDNLNAVCCATASNTALSSIPNLYAILPAAKGQAGPYDPEESAQAIPGQTIYLSGGAGVAAGYYDLLPARYALAAGAVLIQLEPSIVSASSGQIGALASGTPVIAGYLSTGTTGLHTSGATDYEGVAVYPSGYAEELSSYTLSNASSYFGNLAQLAGTGRVAEPADAGTLTLSVTPAAINTLNLQGSVLTAPATGGRGAQVNLSAPDLVIAASDSGAGDGSTTVSAGVLQSWNAGSLTLGGAATPLAATIVATATTSTTTDNTSIAVEANSVTVQSGVQLTADQIELVAQQSIDVQAGALLQSTSGKSGTPLTTLPSVSNVILTDTSATPNASFQAALLGVSDLTLPVVCRSSACIPSAATINVPSAATPAPNATIAIETGATLNSGGALAVDAPGSVTLAGTLQGKGASWSLSSSSIAFSGAGSTDTLNIGTGVLASLQQAGAVRLTSQGDIDIEGPVSLGVGSSGTPTLNSLTLIGNSIDDQTGDNVVFGAANLNLGGNIAPNTASSPPAATAGSATLSLIANTVTVGPGVLAINGFGQTTAQIAGALQTKGAGYLNVGGNLTVNAVELTPAPDAADEPGTTLAATGALNIGAPTTASAGTTPTLVGGSLTLAGGSIDDAGVIVAPSGIVELEATGNLHLASTASISTAGTTLPVVNQSAASPGGLVILSSAGGNSSLDAGSTVSVAGSAAAPAGNLTVEAGSGTVTIAGTIDGAAAGNTGGSLSIYAGNLAGGLGSLLANPGLAGFSGALNVRVRTGSLDLPSAGAITSNSITLTADTGEIDIAGVLSAPSAAQRGLIDLSGGTGVTLESTGQLHADGSGSSGRGGEIDLNSVTASCPAAACSSTGSITLDSGSVITTDGTAQMGELVLRAPALVSGNDVAINVGSAGLGANVSQVGQVIIEPVQVSATSSASVDSDLANAVANATTFLSAATPTISARLGAGVTPIAVQAGVELQDENANDALTLQSSIDLSQNSTQGQVVNVAVLAADGITVNGTISDGFLSATPTGTASTNLPSGSLTFVAGADLSSANTLSVLQGSSAALVLGPQAVLRTGTGDISLAAAGAIDFQSGGGSAATVYTGGLSGASPIASTSVTGEENFPTDGGNIRIVAGGDVIGAPLNGFNPDNGNYSVTGWLLRGKSVASPTTSTTGTSSLSSVGNYGIDFDDFSWNVGALGGGDVTVAAAGKISNLSAATADSSPDGNATLYGAGGGLQISATGDIGSAQLYVADGQGAVTTNAGMTAILQGSNGQLAGSSIALGNAGVSVWARQSVQVDAIYNPTFVSTAANPPVKPPQFSTYGFDSALNLSSTDGSVAISDELGSGGMLGVLIGADLTKAPGSAGFLALPPDLNVQALQQDIELNNTYAILFPSSTGQLRLVSGLDIAAESSSSSSEIGIGMSDSAEVPTAANASVALAVGSLSTAGLVSFQGAIHVGDSQPAIIAAARDIDNLYFNIPKAADISAGRDIINLAYQGQNIAPSDTTLITAGRDIDYTTTPRVDISVGGEGSLDIFAGRNVDLGISSGIVTTGNLLNANLPSAQGADLTLAVGYGSEGADYASFLTDIITPSSTYQAELATYVESQTGQTGLTYAQALKSFASFTVPQQAALIDTVFFNELLLSGRAANSGSGVGFAEGYAAIDALYPGSRNATAANPNPYSGNLDLIYSQIYTLSGGNISILVPGGDIDVGLAFPPTGLTTKNPGNLGIVAEGSGNIDIYAEGDVNVNASRIFTLGGGNILIWSDEGSIDAGNGSKSSLSAPPPTVLINADGSLTIDYSGSLSGSGIRTIQTDPEVPAGNVDLDAPVGTVNAGDAGIGAAGNINIAAAHVIGALNINFGGSATGVPSDLSGLAASLSGVSSVAAGATTSSTAAVAESAAQKETAPLAQSALSWLEVFVTGLGEENCKQDDRECLRRQKQASP